MRLKLDADHDPPAGASLNPQTSNPKPAVGMF